MCVLQHADKLAALDRREADLQAQLHALASNTQELKNKEGEGATMKLMQPYMVARHAAVTPEKLFR